MEPSQNTISLKMIPRIDYDRIKARMSLVPWGCDASGGEGMLYPSWWPSPPTSPSPPAPLFFHRKTGLLKGRSLNGLHRGCLTLRRLGECPWGLSGLGPQSCGAECAFAVASQEWTPDRFSLGVVSCEDSLSKSLNILMPVSSAYKHYLLPWIVGRIE